MTPTETNQSTQETPADKIEIIQGRLIEGLMTNTRTVISGLYRNDILKVLRAAVEYFEFQDDEDAKQAITNAARAIIDNPDNKDMFNIELRVYLYHGSNAPTGQFVINTKGDSRVTICNYTLV